MHYSRFSSTVLATVAFATSASAHSWVEEMRVIAPNGTFTTDAPGYPRAFVKRGPGVDPDAGMVHLLPPAGTPVDKGLQPGDQMCMPSQQQQKQSDGSPRLQASPGDMVALRYQENGHVTLPDIVKGKPAPSRGHVYIYGTTQPSQDEKVLDVKQWNADGTGGNKKGKLLGVQDYDDGQCYQINGGPISAARQKQFQHKADTLMGQDLWCQNDIKIPNDAPVGKPYTVYWLWDWSTLPNADPGLPNGKAELYSTCMDIDIKASNSGARKQAVQFAQGQDLNQAAIGKYVAALNAGNPQGQPAATSSVPVQLSTSAAPQQPSAAAAQPAEKTVTVTVTAPTSPVQSTSTTLMTVPSSTLTVVASNSPAAAAGIPTISLPNFSGTASPVASSKPSGNGYRFARRGGQR